MSFLLHWLASALQWLFNFVVGIPLHVFSLLLSGLAAMFNAIPAPSFFAQASGWIGNMPPLLAFLLSSLHIADGVGILVAAYTLRFLIRRIPFIG